jgi:hypothetical protein
MSFPIFPESPILPTSCINRENNCDIQLSESAKGEYKALLRIFADLRASPVGWHRTGSGDEYRSATYANTGRFGLNVRASSRDVFRDRMR